MVTGRRWSLGGAVVSLFLAACVHSAEVNTSAITQAWQEGKTIVFIINANEESSSEVYADWSYYLNDFSANVGSDFHFAKVKSESDEIELEGYNEPYSLIFAHRTKKDYFYEGPITEPQVYMYIKKYYRDEGIPGYLNQFKPEEVKVRRSEAGRFDITR